MEILTVAQAAEYMGCSKRHIETILPDLGAFDLARPGAGKRMMRIPMTGIQAYIQRRTVTPPTRAAQRRGYAPLMRRTDK